MKHEKTSQLGFGDLQMQRRKVKSGFFNQINAVIDWHPLRALIEPPYAKGFSLTGHPCYDCMVLFRMELMRMWYGLSDGEIEEQVNDRLSFSRFAGLGMDICGAGPNARTATSWRLSPTTCTEHRGLLCPIASDKGETGVRIEFRYQLAKYLMSDFL